MGHTKYSVPQNHINKIRHLTMETITEDKKNIQYSHSIDNIIVNTFKGSHGETTNFNSK